MKQIRKWGGQKGVAKRKNIGQMNFLELLFGTIYYRITNILCQKMTKCPIFEDKNCPKNQCGLGQYVRVLFWIYKLYDNVYNEIINNIIREERRTMDCDLIVEQNIKLALHNINILNVELKYDWNEEGGGTETIIVEYEYKFEGYVDEEDPERRSVGWRKSSVEIFGKTEGFGFTPPCVYDAIECVYKIVVATQAELAKPFEER